MKRGKLRVSRQHKDGKWGIEGRNRSNGAWVLCFDEEREKRGLDNWLLFDLKYDACGYLQGFVDWMEEQRKNSLIGNSSKQALATIKNPQSKEQIKRKRKRKKERQNRKRNR